MNLSSLRYFIVIAEHLNFTKASEYLFVSQPTLSRQISDLEEELGTQLFFRNQRGLQLTSAGERLLKEAREIIERCDNLRVTIREKENEVAGLLKIGYQGFLDINFVQQALKSTAKRKAHVDVSLFRGSSSELTSLLLTNQLDLIFTVRICVSNLQNISSIKVQENVLQIAVPQDHWLAKSGRSTVHMSELSNEEFVLLNRRVSPSSVDYSVSLCTKSGFSPHVSEYVNDVETALLLVELGYGITFVNSMASIPASSNVKVLTIEEMDNDLDCVVAFRNGNDNPVLPIFISEIMRRQPGFKIAKQQGTGTMM